MTHRWHIPRTILLLGATATVAFADPAPVVTVDFSWRFVAQLALLGSIGSLAQVLDDDGPLTRRHASRFLAGILAAIVVGHLVVDLERMQATPRLLMAAAALSGWMGATVLNRLSAALLDRVDRHHDDHAGGS